MTNPKHILQKLLASKQMFVALAMAFAATAAFSTFADSSAGQLVVRTYQNLNGVAGYQVGSADRLLGGEPVAVTCTSSRGPVTKFFSAPPKQDGNYLTDNHADRPGFGSAKFRVTDDRRGPVWCTVQLVANGATAKVVVTPTGRTPLDLYRK